MWKRWYSVTGKECVFHFLFRQRVSEKVQEKHVKPFVQGTRTHIHTHTVGDKEKLSEALSTPEEAIVSSMEHQSIRSGPQGRRVGMCERRCVRMDGEAVRQAD